MGSCSGGLIAAACTELSGSSAWFERGFVTYSNDAKAESLAVVAALITRCGAVSEQVVRAMVQGAVANSYAQLAVAVTGVAGPTGGSARRPVGTVWFGCSVNGQLHTEQHHFAVDRAAIRAATVRHALQALLAREITIKWSQPQRSAPALPARVVGTENTKPTGGRRRNSFVRSDENLYSWCRSNLEGQL